MPSSEVGSAIRQSRLAKGMRLDDLAARSGFTKGFLSKIENGRASPPIATLMRIADSLRVDVAELLQNDSEADLRQVMVKSHERPQVNRGDALYTYWALAASRRRKLMEPYVIKVPEHVDPAMTFQHPGEEFIFVLEGRMVYRVGEATHEMGPGDSLYFDGEEPHAPQPVGGPVTFLAMFCARPPRPRGPKPKSQNKRKTA